MYTLDANAIIYYLSGETATVALITEAQDRGEILYTPTIVRLELLSKPDITQEEHAAITQFLTACRHVHLDSAIADIAADIRRLYKLKTPDSVIAATALFTGSALVTRNARDFKRIPSLMLEKI